MPIYISNIQAIVDKVNKNLENVIDKKLLLTIAMDIVANNLERIHNDGKAVNGTNIGQYNNIKYKKLRTKRGRRVDKVDASFTGKLSKEFTYADVTDTTANIGFLTQYGTVISAALEKKYGKIIWGLSKEDLILIDEIVQDKINRILNA